MAFILLFSVYPMMLLCLILALPYVISETLINPFKLRYKVVLERVDVDYLATTQVNGTLGLRFYNRTTKSLHGHLKFLTEIKEDAYVSVKEYVLRDNDKLTAMLFQLKVRYALKLDYSGIQNLFKSVKPPMEWPLKKRVTYRLDNWLHEDEKIPLPYAPVGYWKSSTEVYFSKHSRKAARFYFYDHVTEVYEY